ncbi:MAG: hypothetical protein J5858_13700 [Lentisphaeria bacterium]|nr:hypothetical protein [Lentisphaeria bacterium]
MFEKEKKKHLSRIRLIFGLLLAAATLLLTGANRLGDSMAARQEEQKQIRFQWQNAARSLLRNQKDNRELQNLAVSHPEYLLQALHHGLQPESQP